MPEKGVEDGGGLWRGVGIWNIAEAAEKGEVPIACRLTGGIAEGKKETAAALSCGNGGVGIGVGTGVDIGVVNRE